MSERFSLANKEHLGVFLDVLVYTGAMCPKCCFGTRVTSKRWAKCKRCGERVERRKLPKDAVIVPAPGDSIEQP